MAHSSKEAMEAAAQFIQEHHGLSEIMAKAIVQSITEVAAIVLPGERFISCPFDDRSFDIGGQDVPCPVCGMLGYDDSPNLCVDHVRTLYQEKTAK